MNDVTMRGHADGSVKAREKWNWLRWVIFASVATSSGSLRCSKTNCLQPPENVRGQGAVRLRPGPHHVTRGEGVDELTRGLIPEQRPVWITLATFPRQQPQRRQIGCASSVPPHRTTATGEARCVMGGERAGPPEINLSKLAANFRSGFDAVTPS